MDTESREERDHLFVSYAGEDGALAEWLTLKLTGLGYRVWCDQIKLLGGESYPRDIDDAIKNNTFRVLALLSKHSIHKANPRKERTLALSIARERGIDFIIPLNVDDLSPTELDWMTSDLAFISFSRSWADGLKKVVKKLESIKAPKDIARGQEALGEWFLMRDTPLERQEQLWTNLLRITEIPKGVHRFEVLNEVDIDALSGKWAFYLQSPRIVWSFDKPASNLQVDVKKTASVAWESVSNYEGMNMGYVATNLIERCILVYCLRKGMQEEATKRYGVFFPENIFPNNRLAFENYKGKKVSISVVGERTFYSAGFRDKNRYHISPRFKPLLWVFDIPVIRVNIRVYLTDLEGNALDSRKMVSRRKRLCRDWWNYEWLSRMMAVSAWLSDGKETVNILTTDNGNLAISGKAITLKASFGIDEGGVEGVIRADEGGMIDEDSDIMSVDEDLNIMNFDDDSRE
ncbi:MAG: toll/interleukin-1 receptor domain-containing protein [Planctomycetota bacterium]|jgi:hypothetical protein